MPPASRSPRRRQASAQFFGVAAALAAISLVGCASSPQQSGHWIDPALGAKSGLLRTDKVLVACEAWDIAMRQNCQASLLSELQKRGAQPLVARESSLASGRDLDAQLAAEAAGVGARSVLVVALTPAAIGGGGFSGASIGLGGFSWGRGGGAGVGIDLPIGTGGWGSTGFAAQGRLTDISQNRLVWSTTFVAEPSRDFTAQVLELTGALVNAAQGSGLL